MRTLLHLLLVLISILCLQSCDKEEKGNLEGYQPKFVVEGWIEQGDYPHVILTHNIPFFTSLDSAQLAEIVIRWAKITVSDGETSEILTARRDTNYFPAFVYRGSVLRGIAGKRYHLTIEYAGNTLSAETTIPASIPLDSVWFIHKGDHKEKAQLQVRFKDQPGLKNYYKLYTKSGTNKRFVPTLLSNQDDKYFDGKEITLQVNKGPENNLTVKNEPYFKIGDAVQVKFATIPQEGFDFWSSFQDEVMSSSNPLIGSTGKIKSNIKGPGVGLWSGYGSSIYRVNATP